MSNIVLPTIMDRTPAMRAHFAQMERYIRNHPDDLVARNYRLAVFVASRYRGNGLEMEDLIGYAYIGLVEAARHYDPTSGIDFAPYACRWIQGEVCNGLNECGHPIRLPKYTRAIVTCIREAQRRFYLQQGRYAMPEELADIVNLPVDQVSELLLATARFDSLDTPVGEGEDSYCLGDTVAAETDDYDAESEIHTRLKQALSRLRPRERAIIEGIHLQGKDFRQLSRELGLSAERVRQIYSHARDAMVLRRVSVESL